MKSLLLFLLLASTPAVYSQTDLMDWGNEITEEKAKKEEVVKQYEFAPQWLDDKFVISGNIDIPEKSSDEIFQLLLNWIANNYPEPDKVLVKADATGKRLLVNTVYISEDFKQTESYYEMNVAFQAKDSELIFQQYNFQYKALGVLFIGYKSYPFEKLFPNLEPEKKKNEGYLNEFLRLNNKHLSKVGHEITVKNKYSEIKHWDAINNKYPVLGMNRTECILAIGKPEKINNTVLDGKTLEQWVYSIDTYVYFDNGVLYSMQF